MDDSTSILNFQKEKERDQNPGACEAFLSDQMEGTVVLAQAAGGDVVALRCGGGVMRCRLAG